MHLETGPRIVAICVSKTAQRFPGSIPFLNQVNINPAPPRRTIARVQFVANERNIAIQKALVKYPGLSHILMLDSWYLENRNNDLEWDRFIKSYDNPDIILGASTYQVFDTRLLSEPITFFVEIASILEAADSTMNVEGKTGRIRVQAVGSIYIFPIAAWKRTLYSARTDYFLPEHVELCRSNSWRFPAYLSFDHRFFKNPVKYSLMKKVKVTAGYLRRKYVYD